MKLIEAVELGARKGDAVIGPARGAETRLDERCAADRAAQLTSPIRIENAETLEERLGLVDMDSRNLGEVLDQVILALLDSRAECALWTPAHPCAERVDDPAGRRASIGEP